MPQGSGLVNFYRMMEAGEVELLDAPEPDQDIPGILEPRFGCRPYSAAMERGPLWGSERAGGKFIDTGPARRSVEVELTTGERRVVEVCDTCGSGATRDGLDYLAVEQYCEACKRSHRDGEIAALRARER